MLHTLLLPHLSLPSIPTPPSRLWCSPSKRHFCPSPSAKTLPNISTACSPPLAFSSVDPSSSSTNDVTVIQAAWEILDYYNTNDINSRDQPSLQTPEGLQALGASVLVAVEAECQQKGCQPLLGICANNAEEAVIVLQQWTNALNCEFVTPQVLSGERNWKMFPGPVYLKFNAKTKLCYLQAYHGKFRGVIIQIGEKQVGHLPLFLFSKKIFALG